VLVVLGAVLPGLTACGQKGPLYIPDEGGTVITRPGGRATPTAPAPQEQRREDDENDADGDGR
jgi:hypothetical protein